MMPYYAKSFIDTIFAFLLPAQYAPVVSAHLAGKTILAGMLFGSIHILLRYIDFSFQAWNFDKRHMATLHVLYISINRLF